MHFFLRYLNHMFRNSHVPVCAPFRRIYLEGVNLTVVYVCSVYKYIYGSFFFYIWICLKLRKHIYAHTYYQLIILFLVQVSVFAIKMFLECISWHPGFNNFISQRLQFSSQISRKLSAIKVRILTAKVPLSNF